MLTANVVIHFGTPGYIAHPYSRAVYDWIEITKKSGMNRAKSEKGRKTTLEQYLNGVGMSYADYLALEARAKAQFNFGEDGRIIITTMTECLVAAADSARGALRIGEKHEIRTMLRVSPFETDKRTADGKWERFAVVTAGTGAKASNQRGLRVSEYIENFDAWGTIGFDESFVSPAALRKFVDYAGTVGVGASRKMGWGRFAVKLFEVE